MSHHKKQSGLSSRDQELVALGAAIASNCIPCIEYHIPQARKTGLSDHQIGEAIALAEKVRRVPADKVVQTASALLEPQEGPGDGIRHDACGCSDQSSESGGSPDTRTAAPGPPPDRHVRVDRDGFEEDNERERKCCGDDAGDSVLRGPGHNS